MEEEKTNAQKTDEAFVGYREGVKVPLTEAELEARRADNVRLSQEAENQANERMRNEQLYGRPSEAQILAEEVHDSITEKAKSFLFDEEPKPDEGTYE